MAELLQDGVLGIVTGILTTVVLFLAKVLWDTKLRPFLQELRYSGVKIEGKWAGQFVDDHGGIRTNFVLFLTQSALQLGGTSVLKHDSPDNNYEIHFNVVGRIWEGYVVVNFAPIDRRVTSYATAMLKITGGGVNLVGQIAFRDVFQEQVTAEPLHLGRDMI